MNEIIKRLRRLSKSLKEMKCIDHIEQLDKDIDEIEKIFDKATPKKPINRINYRTDINAYYCPNCNGFICNYYDKDNERDDYCCNCGQALDWSDEDENTH